MKSVLPTPRFRAEWPAAQLVAHHPPRFHHANKRLVHSIACPMGSTHEGVLSVSRWVPSRIPNGPIPQVGVVAREGYFTYGPPEPGWIAWHQNFADPVLFGFYASGLFAQDEIMVAEHPALASVPAAMQAAKEPASTDGRGPTPVLVAGVERRCVVDTGPGPGRPDGLYGNHFGRASKDVVQAATLRLDPPTISNIIAIAAIAGGRGTYSRGEVVYTLGTAYAGYAAAVQESHRIAPGAKVEVHTGFWGCGAFGGNRALMVTLQTWAAALAGVDRLVLYHGDRTGAPAVVYAKKLADAGVGRSTTSAVDALVAVGLTWGVSNGT